MNIDRRKLIVSMAASGAAVLTTSVKAQNYPSKPIRLIVPFPPGGNMDVTARALARPLEDTLKTPVIVENKSGAGGAIGAMQAARSAPDGYTIIIGAPSMITTLPLIMSTQYTMQDIVPVSSVSKTSVIISVRKSDERFSSLSDLQTLARKRPGALSAGHPSPGSPNHMALLQLENAIGTEFNVIPYKGSAPALVDLIGGQLDIYFDQVPSSLPYIKSGLLRALAVCGPSPDPALPGVKTVGQLGLKAFDATTYVGIYAPAGIPNPILETLSAGITRAAQDQRMIKVLDTVGSQPLVSTHQEFARLHQEEAALARKFLSEGRLKKEA